MRWTDDIVTVPESQWKEAVHNLSSIRNGILWGPMVVDDYDNDELQYFFSGEPPFGRLTRNLEN